MRAMNWKPGVSVFLQPLVVQVEEYMQGLPNWLSQDIADFGLDVALDQTIEYTKNFTGSYFIQEMQGNSQSHSILTFPSLSMVIDRRLSVMLVAGLADGSGADFQRIYRIHLLAELTRVCVIARIMMLYLLRFCTLCMTLCSQSQCSMIGAWGVATQSTGKTLQLRALDWWDLFV
jgi:isopenicillin-N N-acyltransferase like protein